MSIPLAVITALATGIYLLITSFSYDLNSTCSVCFAIPITISGLSILGSIFYLVRAFVDVSKSYEYTGVASPGFLYDWHQKLKEYYQEYFADQPDFETLADDHFKKQLIGEYIKHTDHNQYVNDQKHARIFQSKVCLIICLSSAIFSLIPFGYNFFNKKDDVHKVEIVKMASKPSPKHEESRTIAPRATPAATPATGSANQGRATTATAPTIKATK
ncbi:hypothetical protein [Spirosoma gilvum]